MNDIIKKFILWLKKIFHIRSKLTQKKKGESIRPEENPVSPNGEPTKIKLSKEKIQQIQPEERTGIVSTSEEAPQSIPLTDKKTVEIKLPEEKTSEVPREQEIHSKLFPKEPKEERLEGKKADEEKIEPETSEKATEEKAEREQLESEEKESKTKEGTNARKVDEGKTSKEKEKLKKGLKVTHELPPDKRGGRPRVSTEQRTTAPLRELRPRPTKPEIVCWNRGWEWIIGIEVPEEFASPRVTQNNELLEQDTSNQSHYHLRHIVGKVKVAWTEGEKDIPIMEEGRNYLIFKMRKDWKGLGRLVRRPTTGYYLAIVPQEWKRNEEMSGSAPVAPENVQINGYKAHFFCLRPNEHTAVAFIDAKGERIHVESRSSRFQLVGNEISDFSEDMGPLFGEEPPRIKTVYEREWNNVGVIVVGEEGSGRNKWRMEFVPQEGAKEQKMPDELTNRQGGWYFVRIYDNHDDLLESMDFRFSAGLKYIQIMNSECLPEPDGYNDVTVQFIHQANCKVEPADEEMHHALEIHQKNDFTIVTIPPRPDYDKTNWTLSNGNAKVNVTVLIERIWWYVGRLGVVPANWTDQPISLFRKDFTAITDKALWVKFPRKRWISEIDIGFNRTRSRSYNVEIEKENIFIPLRDFCDSEEIENKQEEFKMKIWVSSKGTKTYEAIVLKIPTELSLPSEPKLSRVKPPPPPKPEAEVKSPRGKRKGKGFSRNEINKTGLAMKDVKRLHIPYDKRRKSSHSWNIGLLKSRTER